MDSKERMKIELQCLYAMFNDRVDEDVVYIIYVENSGCIEETVAQLLLVSSVSFTGYQFTSDGSTSNGVSHSFNNRNSSVAQSNSEIQSNEQKKQAETLIDGSNKDEWSTIRSKRRSRNVNSSKSNSPQPKNEDNDQNSNRKMVDDSQQDGQCAAGEDGVRATIQKFQQYMVEMLEEKKKTQGKAAYYHNKRMFPVAGFYADVARQLDKRITDLSNELIEFMMKQYENSRSIDLHGLNLNQSCLLVKKVLEERKQKLLVDKQGETYFDIITGWGKHSVSDSRIKTTIMSMLRDQGLIYHHLNEGALRVTITRRR